jgi:hypothetical protein
MDSLEALFVSTILSASWLDAHHHPTPPCGVAEAFALSQTVIENLLKTAPTKEAFLLNLSGLAGGKTLLHRGSLRITRLEELPDRTRYACAWQLRFGGIVGDWAMEETVMHGKWRRPKESDTAAAAASNSAAAVPPNGAAEGGSQADHWERRYRELAATLQRRDEEMLRLKAEILESVRER